MNKTQWLILMISALTDFIISGASSLTAAMVSGETVQMPNKAVLVISLLGGTVAFSRTIQQALKNLMEKPGVLAAGPPYSGEEIRAATTHLAEVKAQAAESAAKTAKAAEEVGK